MSIHERFGPEELPFDIGDPIKPRSRADRKALLARMRARRRMRELPPLQPVPDDRQSITPWLVAIAGIIVIAALIVSSPAPLPLAGSW